MLVNGLLSVKLRAGCPLKRPESVAAVAAGSAKGEDAAAVESGLLPESAGLRSLSIVLLWVVGLRTSTTNRLNGAGMKPPKVQRWCLFALSKGTNRLLAWSRGS